MWQRSSNADDPEDPEALEALPGRRATTGLVAVPEGRKWVLVRADHAASAKTDHFRHGIHIRDYPKMSPSHPVASLKFWARSRTNHSGFATRTNSDRLQRAVPPLPPRHVRTFAYGLSENFNRLAQGSAFLRPSRPGSETRPGMGSNSAAFDGRTFWTSKPPAARTPASSYRATRFPS